MPTRKPTLLFVDDEPEGLEALKVSDEARIMIREPSLVAESDVLAADLVLVDLKLTEWPDRLSANLAQSPQDGLALIAVLRSQTERFDKRRPTSFAIYSSYLDEVWGNLPPEYRAHALARDRNIEWAFEKAKTQSAIGQFVSLAKATHALPTEWPQGTYQETRKTVYRLLGLTTKLPWLEDAWTDVEACHSPVHDLVQETHGVVFLRWLLQRILPYPCFLWNETQLGIRLGLKSKGLSDAIDRSASKLPELVACEYRGILSGFQGRRWWRAGIEAALWKITDGGSSSTDAVRSILKERGLVHGSIDDDKRIICLDESFLPLETLHAPTEVVRIQPDDWPPFADFAWTTVVLAKRSERLHSLVVADDQVRLAENPK